jgi:hypothetical protein
MSKEYFSHDYYSRIDPKVKRLRKVHGMMGLGVYWSIVEMLYEQGGRLPISDFETIADELGVDVRIVESIVNNFELFKKKSDKFYSKSGLQRIKIRNEKSIKARGSANLRWGKNDANALPSQSECNAKKEKKVQKIKANKKKLNEAHSEFEIQADYMQSWNRWKQYKQTEHSFTFKSLDSEQTAFLKLVGLSDGDGQKAKKIISQSIGNGWKGLFDLKDSDITKGKPERNSMKDSIAMGDAYINSQITNDDD